MIIIINVYYFDSLYRHTTFESHPFPFLLIVEHIANYKDYTNSTQWMTLDIGVATVEKPYDFDDVSFKIYCSYIPTTIPINYNTHVDEKVGTNVVALGWGRDRGSIVST